MSPRTRRRRAAVLLALSLACGALAASEVSGRIREVESRVGGTVPVVVAARDVPPEAALKGADLAGRDVPARFVPPDGLASVEEAVGASPVAGLAQGSYVTAGVLGARTNGSGEGGGGVLRRGERAAEVAVVGAEGLEAGSRVDVVVSTEAREGPGRTYLAMEDVEVLEVRAADETASGEGGEGVAPSAVATLRVRVRQAVFLAAAQNYAREVRLLPRPAGDRRRSGRAAVAASGL